MHGEDASVVQLGNTADLVGDFEFEDRGWIHHSAITFTEAACSCCDGLLADGQGVIK